MVFRPSLSRGLSYRHGRLLHQARIKYSLSYSNLGTRYNSQSGLTQNSSSFVKPAGPSTAQVISKAVNPGRPWGLYSVFIGVLGGIFVWDYYYNARTLSRNTRTVYNGIMLVLDYKLNYDTNNLDKMNGVHERAAARLLNVCKKNGGLYVKAGQAIGIQVAILPKPYHALAQLFDSAEPIPIAEVERVIHEELGMWPEELFMDFDPKPIGSASIAQVHKATLHTGEQVAVKVQRPDIRKHAKWDLLAFRLLMKVYERIFDLPLSFASEYVSHQIELETHFDHERENTERIRNFVLNDPPKNLRGGVAYVPAVHAAFCTPRLLVMEYIDGAVKMTDVEGMERKLGLNTIKVMNSVCEVFAAQVFRWGFVNADPHPSNVLIRQHPRKPDTHQIVLIDHGLSVPLSPSFRQQYAKLWRCLFTKDLDGLREVTKEWGIDLGDDSFSPQMLGSAVLLQGWSSSPRSGQRSHGRVNEDRRTLTKEEKLKKDLEIQRQMKATAKRFLTNYEMIPKELILLGRSMRIIQANNQALGSPVDRISILARGASDSLYTFTVHPQSSTSPAPKPSIGSRLILWLRQMFIANIEWVEFRLTITGVGIAIDSPLLIRGVLWLDRVWRRMTAPIVATHVKVEEGDDGLGRDLIQQQVMDMAKDMGVEIDENIFKG